MEWNTIYDSKGLVQDNGFTLEVAIPFRSLQYPDLTGQLEGHADA